MQKTLFRCLADMSCSCTWGQADHATRAGEESSPGSFSFLFLRWDLSLSFSLPLHAFCYAHVDFYLTDSLKIMASVFQFSACRTQQFGSLRSAVV